MVILARLPFFHRGSATSVLPHRFPDAGVSAGMREMGSRRWWSRRGGNAGAKPELLCRYLPGSAVTRGGKAHPTLLP